MGYDDNSRLTGVTGGGLPAQIWRETMERIHLNLPASPLPEFDSDDEFDGDQILVADALRSGGEGTSFFKRLFEAIFGKARN